MIYLEDNVYIITRIFTYHDSNHALPESKTVIAHITWAGGSSAPQVNLTTGSGSKVHSLTTMRHGLAAAASNEQMCIIFKESVEVHDKIVSTTMVYHHCENRLWFFGEKGSDSILRIDMETGEQTTKNLQYTLPLETTFLIIYEDSLYIHGYDKKREPDRLYLDLTLKGSMLSGRRFLNLGFILAGVFMLGTQACTIIDRTLIKKTG